MPPNQIDSRSRSAGSPALPIANSPLVKTAIAGEDANWGRVVMAVGKAGEPADRDRLSIWFGGIRGAHHGERDPAYDEAEGSAGVKKPGNRPQGGPRLRRRAGPRAPPPATPWGSSFLWWPFCVGGGGGGPGGGGGAKGRAGGGVTGGGAYRVPPADAPLVAHLMGLL